MGLREESEYKIGRFSSARDFKRHLDECESILSKGYIAALRKEVASQHKAFAEEFSMMAKDPMWRRGK